jgi:ATP-dependent helicase HrpA
LSCPRKRESSDVGAVESGAVESKVLDSRLRGNDEQKQERALDATAYANLHRALLTGLPTQIGHRVQPADNKLVAGNAADKKAGERKAGDRKAGGYEGPRGRRFQLFPGSWLIRKPPPWVLSATLLDTEKVWAMTNAAIEPQWAIDELGQLLARRHHDPRWSRSQGRVVGSEQISLFGLVLAPKRPVHYGGLYPEESRAIFARDALVTGEINTRSGFLQRNLAMLDKAREEEAKQRRAGLVVDEDWMAAWYLERLPPDVHDAQALDAWYGKLPAPQKAALEWSLDDLLVGDETDAARFPPEIALGDARLAVSYRFEPGAPDDGMTVSVPLHLLNALDPVRLDWLAPGFAQDKAVALIRSLPKAQRRNFVPAPDFARAFHEAHPGPEDAPFAEVLARFLQQVTGAAVAVDEFDESALEPHLRANLRLLDAPGRDGKRSVLAESRDLAELRTRFGEHAARAFAAHAADGLGQRGLLAFPEEPIPASLPGAAGMPAYPALHDDGDSVSLQVHAEQETARRHHPRGVRRLLWLALSDARKQARRQLPISPKTGLLYAAIESAAPRAQGSRDGDRLRADLVDGAFAALVADGLDGIRDAAAFDARREDVAKRLFAESMERLQQAEVILAAVSQARASLESPLMGWASANLDDMRAQLAALTPPGFLRDVPATALRDYPRYLKALALRGERALRDPVRDQARMLEVTPFIAALAQAEASGASAEPGWQALRWELEELRVSLFAQELGSRGVSPKKLAARLSQLRR